MIVGKKENGKSNKRKKRELNIKTVSYFIAIVGKHWLIFGRLRGKGTTLKNLLPQAVCCLLLFSKACFLQSEYMQEIAKFGIWLLYEFV